MTFQELLIQIQTLRIEESRAYTEEYFEAVISKEGLDPWNKNLTAYFGSPLKPEGCAPSVAARRSAAPYGGIRKDQTMYFRRNGKYSEYALLWPWGSGARITVKVIQSRDVSLGNTWKNFFKKLFSPNFQELS